MVCKFLGCAIYLAATGVLVSIQNVNLCDFAAKRIFYNWIEEGLDLFICETCLVFKGFVIYCVFTVPSCVYVELDSSRIGHFIIFAEIYTLCHVLVNLIDEEFTVMILFLVSEVSYLS